MMKHPYKLGEITLTSADVAQAHIFQLTQTLTPIVGALPDFDWSDDDLIHCNRGHARQAFRALARHKAGLHQARLDERFKD